MARRPRSPLLLERGEALPLGQVWATCPGERGKPAPAQAQRVHRCRGQKAVSQWSAAGGGGDGGAPRQEVTRGEAHLQSH